MFGYDTYSSDATIESLIARYRRTGRAKQVNFRALVPQLVSADRATHLLHPYPAKLLMHIPVFFLANSVLSKKGDVVADPFCGSGTVLLESRLAGRRAIGADSNPFAQLLTTVKLTSIPPSTLDRASNRLFDRIPRGSRIDKPDVVNLDHWFYPHVTEQLQCLREAIESTRRPDVRDFFRICFSSCVRKVSLADPRLAVPVRLREGQYPEGHYLREKTDAHIRRLRRVNVFSVFEDVLHSNQKRLRSIETLPDAGQPPNTISNDARRLSFAARSSRNGDQASRGVQLVISSPPYPGAQKYIRSSSLSLGWLNLCASNELSRYKHKTIGREEFRRADYDKLTATGIPTADEILRQIHRESPIRATIASTYLSEMTDAIDEIWSQLNRGGYFVLIAANSQICGREFKTQQYLRDIAEKRGFTTVLRLIDDIRSRGLMTKRNKTASVITREWVHVFAKP